MNTSFCLRIVSLVTISTLFALPCLGEGQEVTTDSSEMGIPLTLPNVQEFVRWAARVDRLGRLKVRQQIEIARQNKEQGKEQGEVVSKALFKQFETAPEQDLGQRLIILSIIGELKNPLSTTRLTEIVNNPLPEADSIVHGVLSSKDAVEMIQSKAVQCLAYLNNRVADSLTLSVIKSHPSKAVRSAAIDAYLYNHGDSLAAKQRLRNLLRDENLFEDLPFVDRIRNTKNISREAFDEGIERFYALHPEARAPKPRDYNAQNEITRFLVNVISGLFFTLAIILILLILILYLFRKSMMKKS